MESLKSWGSTWGNICVKNMKVMLLEVHMLLVQEWSAEAVVEVQWVVVIW